MIDYDPQRTSLYSPALRPTVFSSPVPLSVLPWMCAEMSRLVYAPFEKDPTQLQRLSSELRSADFTLLHTFNHDGTQAMAVRHGATDQLVVVFRGTEPDLADFATDLNGWSTPWPQGGDVHAGFCKALDAVWPQMTVALGRSALELAIFAGHSLGAALAQLAASRVQSSLAQLITIGSPAAGDDAFVATLAQLTQLHFVNCCDVVTRLPPDFLGFAHAGPVHYIDRSGQVHTPAHPLAKEDIATDQNTARVEYNQHYAWQLGTVILRDLADHSPINYVRALM